MTKKIIFLLTTTFICASLSSVYSDTKGLWINGNKFTVQIQTKYKMMIGIYKTPTLDHGSTKKTARQLAEKQVIDDWANIIVESSEKKITKKDALKIIAKNEYLTGAIKGGSVIAEKWDADKKIYTMTYSAEGNNLRKIVEEAWKKD